MCMWFGFGVRCIVVFFLGGVCLLMWVMNGCVLLSRLGFLCWCAVIWL